MSHECPANDCTKSVSADMLMCRTHWFMVPKQIRDRVWREWRIAPQSPEHVQAITNAISAVNGK
jgi:hypothetical protein